VATKNRFDVHHGRAGNRSQRDDFHAPEQSFDFGWRIRLDRTHDDILSSLASASPFVEHSEGFSHPSGVAEKDLQPAAPLVLFLGLDLAEKAIWIRAGELARHDGCTRKIV